MSFSDDPSPLALFPSVLCPTDVGIAFCVFFSGVRVSGIQSKWEFSRSSELTACWERQPWDAIAEKSEGYLGRGKRRGRGAQLIEATRGRRAGCSAAHGFVNIGVEDGEGTRRTRGCEHGMVLRALARLVGRYLLVCRGPRVVEGEEGSEEGSAGDGGQGQGVRVTGRSSYWCARRRSFERLGVVRCRRCLGWRGERAGAQRATRNVGVRQWGPMRASREGTATIGGKGVTATEQGRREGEMRARRGWGKEDEPTDVVAKNEQRISVGEQHCGFEFGVARKERTGKKEYPAKIKTG
ncbi:hypothetical protein DFH09DRAFT_1080177 [Mycena vulgaris]|nr:hypothetical protein DFH09DRAFT_1080177 [Mycena vulgaris]